MFYSRNRAGKLDIILTSIYTRDTGPEMGFTCL
jgi:hypothetical protein